MFVKSPPALPAITEVRAKSAVSANGDLKFVCTSVRWIKTIIL